MRRQHYAEQSYIDWLKSLGCIMYTPLREDLQDLISGNYFIATGDGAYEFSNGYCEVTAPSTSPASPLNITIPALSINTSKDYTVLCEAQLIQKSVANNSCRMLLFSNQAISSEGAPQWCANPFRSAIPTDFSLNKAARIYSRNNTTMYYLLNGAINSSEAYTLNLPALSSPYNQGFTLGCAGHNNYRECKFRVRDLMFFTQALTLTQVRQIQGYE